MATPYIGEIRIFGGNFAPNGWAFCDGAILSIAEYDALFNLIGTTYGGDGQSTFGLPDLRGRIPVHQGGGVILAETGGRENVLLSSIHLPAHSHELRAGAGGNKETSPANALLASGGVQQFASNRSPASATLQAGLAAAGATQPHDNMMPYTAVSFIISLFGIFPSPA